MRGIFSLTSAQSETFDFYSVTLERSLRSFLWQRSFHRRWFRFPDLVYLVSPPFEVYINVYVEVGVSAFNFGQAYALQHGVLGGEIVAEPEDMIHLGK